MFFGTRKHVKSIQYLGGVVGGYVGELGAAQKQAPNI
jgi:uncharacterized membrane protein YheB (UPF0754 family)